jgi:hypothetical protein
VETNKQTKIIQRINQTRSWFFEKINKIEKPLVSLIKRQRDTVSKYTESGTKKGDITTDTAEIHRFIKSFSETCTPQN